MAGVSDIRHSDTGWLASQLCRLPEPEMAGGVFSVAAVASFEWSDDLLSAQTPKAITGRRAHSFLLSVWRVIHHGLERTRRRLNRKEVTRAGISGWLTGGMSLDETFQYDEIHFRQNLG